MLDEIAVEKAAVDFCDRTYGRGEFSLDNRRVCSDPPATYFGLKRTSGAGTGGPCGVIVYHEDGRVADFGTWWFYELAEVACEMQLNDTSPALVFKALLHPDRHEYVQKLARERRHLST